MAKEYVQEFARIPINLAPGGIVVSGKALNDFIDGARTVAQPPNLGAGFVNGESDPIALLIEQQALVGQRVRVDFRSPSEEIHNQRVGLLRGRDAAL
jgi:hypothetical protein